MSSSERALLENAYRATTYTASVPLLLRVGQRSVLLDAVLEEWKVEEWAYLTAWNPRSVPRPLAENNAAQDELVAALRARGLAVFHGVGVGDDGDWPPEPSVLALGIGRDDALALARKHGQAAILVGRRGGPAELAWT